MIGARLLSEQREVEVRAGRSVAAARQRSSLLAGLAVGRSASAEAFATVAVGRNWFPTATGFGTATAETAVGNRSTVWANGAVALGRKSVSPP